MKAGKCEYQFVEVMACPAGFIFVIFFYFPFFKKFLALVGCYVSMFPYIIGCLNGGGQIKPRKGQSGKELIQNLEGVYLKEVTFISFLLFLL